MSLWDITWTDIVTAILALYAAGLSTYIAVREWRAKTADIRVKTHMGLKLQKAVGHEVGWYEPSGPALVVLTATNPGERPVILSSVGFVASQQKHSLRFDVHISDLNTTGEFPYKLSPEESCEVSIEARKIAATVKRTGRFRGMVEVAGFYQDQIGRTHMGRGVQFDVEVYAPSGAEGVNLR